LRPSARRSPRRWFRDRFETARRDDVTDAGEPRERERVRAGGDPEAGHFRQAARDQAGLAVVAEAQAVGGARRDRDDVLEGPAELDTDQVRIRIQPERAAAEAGDDSIAELRIGGRNDGRGRQAARDLVGEIRP